MTPLSLCLVNPLTSDFIYNLSFKQPGSDRERPGDEDVFEGANFN